ncbi:MAG: cytochrome c biogenesis protein ResB [Nocardioides sp.]
MTATESPVEPPGPERTGRERAPDRRSGELTVTETLRWAWRQLTSMRTALLLLLLLALAAVPGSIVPQRDVDSLRTSRWQAEHPELTPVFERLQLFSVYDSVWFSAIYLLLMASLIGCIVPRCAAYWRAMRRPPPPAPRHLDRLPGHTSYLVDDDPERASGTMQDGVQDGVHDRVHDRVHDAAGTVLRSRGYRVVTLGGPASDGGPGEAVCAERGYLREAGNLLFHASTLLVLVGFAIGALFGYKGGAIVLVGSDGFANNLTQYDDFAPGSLFDPDVMEDFSFGIDEFDVEWIERGKGQGMARKFVSSLRYRERPGGPEKRYDLRVNHPLKIGGTEIFLIGHGYAPLITVRDGNGDVAYSEPVIFLPEGPDLLSYGVVKAHTAEPEQIGLEGLFFPTYLKVDGEPINVMGDDRNPTLSMTVYTGDLGLSDGSPQSVYVLDKSRATVVRKRDGKPFRVDLQPGQGITLPDGMGSVSFDGVVEWNRVQISRTPGIWLALGGVVLALLGLLGSLFIRPRRVWIRASPNAAGGGMLVEIAGLDRSGNGDLPGELAAIEAELRQSQPAPPEHTRPGASSRPTGSDQEDR